MLDNFFEKTCPTTFFIQIEICQNYFNSISIPPKPRINVPVVVLVIFRRDWLSWLRAEVVQGGQNLVMDRRIDFWHCIFVADFFERPVGGIDTYDAYRAKRKSQIGQFFHRDS
jgi:hypothetical protein